MAKAPLRSAGYPRFPATALTVAVVAVLAIVVLILVEPRAQTLSRWETVASDVRTALFSHRTKAHHADVVLVTMTEEALGPFAGRTPIDRGLLARIVGLVDAAEPRVIGLDMLFTQPTERNKDLALQQALTSARSQIVLSGVDDRVAISKAERAHHERFTALTGRPIGYHVLERASDQVVRNHAKPAAGRSRFDSFPVLLASTVQPGIRPAQKRIAWLQKVEGGGLLRRLFNIGAKRPFLTLAASDLLKPEGRFLSAALGGRVVLIGSDLAGVDRHPSALTQWTGRDMSGLEIQAQVVAQLIDGRVLAELSPTAAAVLVLLLAVFGGFIGWSARYYLYPAFAWGLAIFALLIADAIIHTVMHVSLPFLPSLLACTFGLIVGHNLGIVSHWEERRHLLRLQDWHRQALA